MLYEIILQKFFSKNLPYFPFLISSKKYFVCDFYKFMCLLYRYLLIYIGICIFIACVNNIIYKILGRANHYHCASSKYTNSKPVKLIQNAKAIKNSNCILYYRVYNTKKY